MRLTPEIPTCIRSRISEVLTVRITPELLAKTDARAAQLGVQRARYVRGLIERDLKSANEGAKRRFASEDLVGRFQLGGTSARNKRVREQLHRKARNDSHR